MWTRNYVSNSACFWSSRFLCNDTCHNIFTTVKFSKFTITMNNIIISTIRFICIITLLYLHKLSQNIEWFYSATPKLTFYICLYSAVNHSKDRTNQ